MHGIMPRKSSTSSNSKAIIPELEMVVHTQVKPRQMDEVLEIIN